MDEYNCNFGAKIFGLNNSANLCYFNSLLQFILSSTSFNSGIAQAYLKLPDREKPGVENIIKILLRAENDRIYDASAILQIIGHRLQIHNQNDANECMLLLLEELSTRFRHNIILPFKTEYAMHFYCKKCDRKSRSSAEQRDFSVFYSGGSDVQIWSSLGSDQQTRSSLGSDPGSDLEQHIKYHVSIPEDYKCETPGCTGANTGGRNEIMQIYVLRSLSSNIIVHFKKYESGKSNIPYPEFLHFSDGNSGTYVYRLMAELIHHGSPGSGHYICRATRPKPGVITGANELVENLSGVGLENRINKLSESVQPYSPDLCDLYEFNDAGHSRVQPRGPDPGSYMLMYHLIGVDSSAPTAPKTAPDLHPEATPETTNKPGRRPEATIVTKNYVITGSVRADTIDAVIAHITGDIHCRELSAENIDLNITGASKIDNILCTGTLRITGANNMHIGKIKAKKIVIRKCGPGFTTGDIICESIDVPRGVKIGPIRSGLI